MGWAAEVGYDFQISATVGIAGSNAGPRCHLPCDSILKVLNSL